jgi:hypothetical protein
VKIFEYAKERWILNQTDRNAGRYLEEVLPFSGFAPGSPEPDWAAGQAKRDRNLALQRGSTIDSELERHYPGVG